MRAWSIRTLVSIAVVVGFVFGTLGAASAQMVTAPGGSESGAAAPATTGEAPSSSPAVASPTSAGTNAAATLAQNALETTHTQGVSPRDVFVPRPSASPQQQLQSRDVGYVTPLYDAAPAPSGLAYYGLSEGAGGTVVPSILNTTSLLAQVDSTGSGIVAQDLFASSPDSYGIQLNAVETNITLFGQSGYSFWTQNVVEYYPNTDFMVLVDNIWNFSSPTGDLAGNPFYSSNGYNEISYYYDEVIVPFPVSYPWDLSLYLNSSILDGRDAVTFTANLAGPGGPIFNAPYDTVIFNSLNTGGTPLTTPSNFTANGYSYNPIGLTDDYEVIFGGPGGGSNSDLSSANAILGLSYWNAKAGEYQSTPSAYNYGGETGETVTGASIAWGSSPSAAPAGTTKYGIMTTGPSVMRGLWDAGAPGGAVQVKLAVTPVNAFDVFTPWNNTATLANFVYAQPYAESDLYGPSFYVTPGKYTLTIELSNYDPVTLTLNVESALTVTVHLRADYGRGIYTPIWAFSNSELGAISYYGTGTAFNPYVLFDNQVAPLSSVFGLYNDYTFPVYPGVFLSGTTATTYLLHAAKFTTATSDFEYPGAYLPQTNQLQYWFSGVSHVAVVDAADITGWFGASAYYPLVWDTFNMVFYASSHNLIAGNYFATESQALLLFSGGTLFGPLNTAGGNNTIWGNVFTQLNPPTSTIGLMPYASGLGIELAEQDDLIYNNWVATPTTAFMTPLNLYSGDAFLYTDYWNIPVQSAFNVHFAAGFPLVPLFGSIVGGPVQGGNYWWDYGTTATTPNPYNGAVNPYGVLPYDENATTLTVYIYGPSYYYSTYIYNGGDYAPLLIPVHHH
jgi:thermopsin